MTLKLNPLILFPLTGFTIGMIFALCKFAKIDSSLPFIWLSAYGIMLLLAIQYTKNLKLLFLITLVPSFLASIPCLWIMNAHYDIKFASIILAVLSAHAINAFHLNYHENYFNFSYKTLFHSVWDSFVQLSITFIFSILCYGILLLASSLFELVQLHFLDAILSKSWFQWWSQAFFVSIGLLICAQTQHIISSIRRILLLICKYLFVPLALIGLIFIIFSINIIITNPLSLNHPYLFSSIAFLCVIFVNGIYQDGQMISPYPRIITIICQLFLITTPIFTFLSLLSIFFSDKNNLLVNNLHADNFLFLLNIILLFLYNISYSIIALICKKPWLKSIEKTNIILAFILIILTLLTTNPWTLKIIDTKKVATTLYQVNIPKPHLSRIKPSPTSLVTPLESFKNSGLFWGNSSNLALTLGFDKTPINLCIPLSTRNVGGIVKNNYCEWIDGNNVQKSRHFNVLSGPENKLVWKSFEFISDNDIRSSIILLDYVSTRPKTICRLIYQNHIVIGTSSGNKTCEFIINGKIAKEENLVQFLYHN